MQQIKTHAFYENNTLQRSKELSAKRIKIQSNKSSLEEKGGGEGQGSQRKRGEGKERGNKKEQSDLFFCQTRFVPVTPQQIKTKIEIS